MTEAKHIIWSSAPNDSAAGTDGIRAMPKSKAATSKNKPAERVPQALVML